MFNTRAVSSCRAAVIWIDWYAYHVARFRGLEAAQSLSGAVAGFELVGGAGVHTGLKFREELPRGLRIETLQPHLSWHEASKTQLARQLWKRLSELDPEVVLVPGYYTLPAIAAALWARIHGRASVLMTESTAQDHRRNWWKEKGKSLGLRMLFDWAVAGGKAHVDYLKLLGFPANRTASFYDVVDNDAFREGTLALRMQSPRVTNLPSRFFLYVGRLAAEKNVRLLLESWMEYRSHGGSWSLVLVGDGPEANGLRTAVAASPFAKDVLLPGLKGSKELLPFYAFSSCFILPSTREPWGLVVNEAMSSGLPVLVSKYCGCAPDLVEPGRNGFLFDPIDKAALTALLSTFENLSDHERKQMGDTSAEIIRRYTPLNFGRSIAFIADAMRHQPVLRAVPGETR